LSKTDVRRIIVETNGLADPAESIKQFWFDEEMKINAYLHSVISIFSVEKFPTIKQQELFEKQIVFANKALITFVDKCT
jgi:G3E family GTPase